MSPENPGPVQQDQRSAHDAEQSPLSLRECTVDRASEDQANAQCCEQNDRPERKQWIVRQSAREIEFQQCPG